MIPDVHAQWFSHLHEKRPRASGLALCHAETGILCGWKDGQRVTCLDCQREMLRRGIPID